MTYTTAEGLVYTINGWLVLAGLFGILILLVLVMIGLSEIDAWFRRRCRDAHD